MTGAPAEFHVVDDAAASASLVGRRRVRTLEGRLEGSWLSQPWPVCVAYVALVTMAEVATVVVNARTAIALHAATLVLLITHAALVRRVAPPVAKLLVACAPVPLLRIVSLTSPLAQFTYIQWFMVISVILYAGIVTSIKLLKPDLASLGLRLPAARQLPLEAGVILLGFALGWMEYQILKPGPLVPDLTFRSLVAPILVLYVATGLLEELLFRGLIQRYAIEAMGRWGGVALVTILFAVLHAGWASWLDILFVGAVGFVYSLVILRTKSLVGVSISHGITNTMLFLVMPLVAGAG